ncbi:cytochrome P450 71A2 [Artemisia annua]|uniref:Cytochrome P450 71A2 n=1 Tax=Artemisia annua TaxID=35608 RepID=A0A2U1KVG8_ARTAN|nr:cytochrome P450 71A2 [Artemisia annua]
MLIHLGSVPVVVVSSVEGARAVLKTHDLIFSNRPKLSIPAKLTYGAKDIGFAPYGEYWRQVKSITVVHLLSRKRVRSFRSIRERETISMIDMIGKTRGSVVDLSEMIISLTNNIICQVALGRIYGDYKKFKELLVAFQNLLGVMSVGSYIPWLSWVDWLRGLEGRTNKVAKELNEFFDGVIEEHINKNKMVNDGNEKENDLVDILLDIQRDDTTDFKFERDTIKAVISDVFSGGTDTTFSSIEWALSELIRHPKTMEKLQLEVTKIAQGRPMITEDDMVNMHYLKAVLKETLRLHTPLPILVPHESRQDVNLMGYDIPQGTQVMINVSAIARDPLLWDEPDKFKPERFLNSSIDYKGFDFELLPFGAGRRGCPGIEFTAAINELVLANIVYKYDLALPNDGRPEELDISEIVGIVVHKKSPLLVVPTSRF